MSRSQDLISPTHTDSSLWLYSPHTTLTSALSDGQFTITLSGKDIPSAPMQGKVRDHIAAPLKRVAEGTCTALTLSQVRLSEDEMRCLREALLSTWCVVDQLDFNQCGLIEFTLGRKCE